jgi:hypothetical protein
MNEQETSNVCVWRKTAASLKKRLDVDHRNHEMLSDPWRRVAHSMVQGWRIIASQGRLGYVPQPRRRLTTWKEAASSMNNLLNIRMRTRLLDNTSWKFWASHVPRVHLRYVKKTATAMPCHEAE